MSHSTDDYITNLSVSLASAYVSNHSVAISDLGNLLKTIHTAIVGEPVVVEATPVPLVPAVSIKKSVTADYIVCLEDGKKLKMLKRHLKTAYSLTPDEYRVKWGLPSDYPMVCPNYAKARSDMALKIGLGRKSDVAKAA